MSHRLLRHLTLPHAHPRSVFLVCWFGVAAYIFFGGVHRPGPGESMHDACHGRATGSFCSPFDQDLCTEYFSLILNSMNHMFILLTTANYPVRFLVPRRPSRRLVHPCGRCPNPQDIMMPVYDCFPFASLFFIVFLVIGLYLVTNIILAVAYDAFQDNMKIEVLELVDNRSTAMGLVHDTITSSRHFRATPEGIALDSFTVHPASAVCTDSAFLLSHCGFFFLLLFCLFKTIASCV